MVRTLDDTVTSGQVPVTDPALGRVVTSPTTLPPHLLRGLDVRARFPGVASGGTPLLGVPLRAGDDAVGALYLAAPATGRGFTDRDEEVVGGLAAAAGAVLATVRLHERTERHRRWLAAQADVAAALREPLTRGATQRLLVDTVRPVAEADVAVLLGPDPDGLRVRAVDGLDKRVVGSFPRVPPAVRTVATSGDVIAVGPVTESLWGDDWPALVSYQAAAVPSIDGTSVLVVGWTGADTVPAGLDPDLLRSYADQASFGLQVARAQHDQAQLAVYEDRDRIGRDLHDLVIQRLFAVGLSLQGMTRHVNDDAGRERLVQAVDDLDRTIADIRRTIFDLGRTVAASSLRQDLEQVVDEAAALLGFEPRLVITGRLDTVSDVVAAHLLHVVREQLSNVVRHAHARHVDVILDCERMVELTIRDDGRGRTGEGAGNGLANMQHRARQLGGACRIVTRPGAGFEIRWAVPKEQS
ncbi:MAG: GAF domain-containing sensor histidine kinase [Aeromicrobium erythreum]